MPVPRNMSAQDGLCGSYSLLSFSLSQIIYDKCYRHSFERKVEIWTANLSLTLSAFSFIFTGLLFHPWPFFYSIFWHFGVGLLAYFSNPNQFSREHIFNKFPSLVCWCIVIPYQNQNQNQKFILFLYSSGNYNTSHIKSL